MRFSHRLALHFMLAAQIHLEPEVCELVGLSAAKPIDLTFSLAQLARRGGYEAANLEGWGLAAYEDFDVYLAREPRPASDSQLRKCMESHMPATHLAISHLRQATLGVTCLRNTQPFVRTLGGRKHVFAHNGHLPDLLHHAPDLGRWRPVGDTDSELAYAILLLSLEPIWSGATAPVPEQRIAVVQAFARQLRPLGPANFLYSDGEFLFAHGHRRIKPDGEIKPPGLVMHTCYDTDSQRFDGEGISAQRHGERALMFASVPLSNSGWEALSQGELVVARDGEIVARIE